jgi:DNA-binding CsgD family transcriptional regulator
MWRGQLDEARGLLEQELARVSGHGSEIRLATLRLNLSELELRAGNWELANRHAEDGLGIMHEVGGEGEMILRGARGRVAAHQGRAADAVADLTVALARAENQSNLHQVVRARMSLGFLHLSQSEPERAWLALDGLSELRERMGIGEPGVLPLQADAVETLVALGRLAEAEALVVPLEEQGAVLEHLWAVPVAARCRGLVMLGAGSLDAVIELFESSARGFEEIAFAFDRARSLFALGDALRRAGQRRRAAARLEEARSVFERLGAQLWLERTETELRRAAPRRRRDGELTAAETRVARLVAAGATNKEVAARLFTTVRTVEAHLTRIYRKLGLRSRSELVRKVAEGTVELTDR